MRIYLVYRANYNPHLVRGLGFLYAVDLTTVQAFDRRGTIFSEEKCKELKRRQ